MMSLDGGSLEIHYKHKVMRVSFEVLPKYYKKPAPLHRRVRKDKKGAVPLKVVNCKEIVCGSVLVNGLCLNKKCVKAKIVDPTLPIHKKW